MGAALAKSYRLLGGTYYELGQHGDAGIWLDRAVEQASAAGSVLAENGVYRVLAQTYETQGAARLQQYDILRSAGDLPVRVNASTRLRQRLKAALPRATTPNGTKSCCSRSSERQPALRSRARMRRFKAANGYWGWRNRLHKN